MKSTFYSLLAVSLLTALPVAQAQETIASWSPTGQPGNQVSTAGVGSPGVVPLDVARGPGIAPASAGFSTNSIAANGWDVGGSDRYYTFGFTVTPGQAVTLSEFLVGSRTDPTGPRDFALRYDVDDFASDLGTWTETGNSFVNTALDLSGLPAIEGDVEFRILVTSETAANGGAINGTTLHRLTNYFSGISTGSFRFTGSLASVGDDETPPSVVSVSPPSGSLSVSQTPTLTINFSEAIVVGSGFISIYDADDTFTPVFNIDVTGPNVTASATSLEAALPGLLEFSTEYYVVLDSGIVEDVAENVFAGESASTFWTFTTEALDTSTNILEWNFNPLTGGAGNYGPSPLAPDFVEAELRVFGLTRGPGFSEILPNSGAGGAWGSNSWNGPINLEQAIAAEKFVTFVVGPQVGHSLSITEIAAYNIRRSGTGPDTGQWQYQIGNAEFQNVGSPITWGSTTSSGGNAQTAIPLGSFPNLQDIAPGTPVTFRLVNWGASSAGGTWYLNRFGDSEEPDLVVRGSIEPSADPGDNLAPVLATFVPANGADNVLEDATLTLNFDESIYLGGGNIRIFDAATDIEVDTIDIESNQVSTNINSLVITPGILFSPDETYYILIDSGIVEDFVGNSFAGINDPAFWSFTGSEDFFPPELVSVSPANGVSGIESPTQLVATFDEEVGGSAGAVRLFDADGDVEIATFDVGEFAFQVQFDGTQLIIPLVDSLLFGNTYYVQIDPGALIDAALNEFVGITDSTTWSFTLREVPELLDIEPYEQDFVEFVSLETLPFGWSLSGASASLVYAGDWGDGTGSGLRGNASVLGFQPTSSADELNKTLSLKNGADETITDLTISYIGRAERIGQSGVDRLSSYTVSLNGVEVPALAYSTSEGDGVTKATTVSGLSIPPGGSVIISWFAVRGEPSGSSRQIGLSQVSVSIGAEVFPPALAGVTVDPLLLTSSSATVASAVSSDNGSSISERGFVFAETSINSAPEISGVGVVQTIDGAAEVGAFSALLSPLSASTQYSLRSYAINANGTAYSNPIEFITPQTPPGFDGNYFESFSTFTGVDSLPAGWSAFSTTGSNGYGGVWGTGSGAGFRGVGEIEEVPSGPVLGYQHTSGTGELIVSLTLVNATGGVLDELAIEYLGRSERVDVDGVSRFPAWEVEFNAAPVGSLAYSTSTGLDGSVETTLSGLGIPDGASFTIRWTSDRDLEGSGSSRQIGLANVSVSLPGPSVNPTFASYMDSFFPEETNPDIIGLLVDPDGDGIANILEYYFGSDPSSPSLGLRQVAADGTSVTFEFTRNNNLGDDIGAEYQWSTTLSDWFLSGDEVDGLVVIISEDILDESDPDVDVIQVTATITEGEADGIFIRIQVFQPVVSDLL